MSNIDLERAKILRASLEEIVKEQAESRWNRDPYAEQIAEINEDIRQYRQEIAWLTDLDSAALQKAYEDWLEHVTQRVKRHNELAVAPYTHLTELLTAAKDIRDALETDSPLREVFDAAVEHIEGMRRVWEQEKPPKRVQPETYRQERLNQLGTQLRRLESQLADYESQQARYTQGLTNLGLLNALLKSMQSQRR